MQLRSENVISGKQIATLIKAIYALQLECNVLERATEVLRHQFKHPSELRKSRDHWCPKEKHQLNELFQFLHIPKSIYCYRANRLRSPDKYVALRTNIHTLFRVTDSRYGYRRIHASLKNSGIWVSEKVVRRLMKEA